MEHTAKPHSEPASVVPADRPEVPAAAIATLARLRDEASEEIAKLFQTSQESAMLSATVAMIVAATAQGAKRDRSADLRSLIDRWHEKRAVIAALERAGEEDDQDDIGEAYDELAIIEDEVDHFRAQSADEVRMKARFALDYLFGDQSAQHTSDMFAWQVLRELVAG